jgi:5-methylcytosine-specific restriction endonuclease McrA
MQDIVNDLGLDPEKSTLGNLCRKGHDYQNTGHSLRYIRKSGRYAGTPGECVECAIAKTAKRKAEKPDEVREADRRYREANREKLLEQKKDYYQRNKETIIARSNEWQRNNRDRYNELKRLRDTKDGKGAQRSREYRQRNYDQCNANWNRQRARDAGAPFTIYTGEDLQKHRQFFDDLCAYCGDEEPNWDHVIPLSAGGEDRLNNLAPCCRRCNSSKNNRDMLTWYHQQPFFLTERLDRVLSILNLEP